MQVVRAEGSKTGGEETLNGNVITKDKAARKAERAKKRKWIDDEVSGATGALLVTPQAHTSYGCPEI